MQRHLLAAITAMGIALVADTTGYGAEAPVAEEDEPSVAVIGSEHPAVAPKDRPDVPIAVDPLESERSQAIAANPKHSNLLVLVISKGSIASGKGRCLAYRSSDGGRTWSQPVPLPQTMSGYSCVEADVAYAPDGSRVYVAYSSLGHILLSSSEDNGATWVGPAFALRSILDYYSYEFPRIATPLSQGASNYVYVTASRHYASPGWNVYFARSTDSGQNWSEPRLFAVGDADNNVAGTVTGGAGGEVLVAWSFTDDYGDDTSGIRVARSKNYEDSFDPPNVAVSAPFLEIGGFPDVKIGGKGAAHLVYRRRKNTDKSDIEYIWSPGPPYTSWSKPVIVNANGLLHRNAAPSLTTQRCGNSTVLHLVWEDLHLTPAGPPDGDWNVLYARKIAKAGSGWSKNIRVSNQSSFDAGYSLSGVLKPDVAVSQRGPFATWTNSRGQTDPLNYITDVCR